MRRAICLAWMGCAFGCASLPPFGADAGRQQAQGRWLRPPYATQVGYFGYIMPGSPASETIAGRPQHVLFLWLPDAPGELGVRAISPVRNHARPRPEVDVVDPAYPANRDSEVWFDPALRVERCLGAVDPEDLRRPCESWVLLGENDDSDELPRQPGGAATNALVRIAHASGDDPMRVLVRGLYRVALGTAKPGAVQGSFLLQVGTPGDLPGMALARDLPTLAGRVLGTEPAQR